MSKTTARPAKPAQKESYVFGTAYYPDHWPESEWARDLDRIRDAGIEAVRFGEFSWSWYEPLPGKFDFKQFDRFVKLVEARRLRLVLCTPTATPPPWFDRLFPDGRLQDVDGRHCRSARHFWCWNHAASRRQAERTIRRLAAHFRDCGALWGWQIDNEPNYAEELNIRDRSKMYDFNPASRSAFAGWLKAKYETLDRLNEAWWSSFWSQSAASWQDVIPQRVLANPHAWLDFMQWREASMAEFVQWQAAILREITPGVRIGCNIPETGVAASVAIGQDYWAQARGLDWVGTDLYQATGNRPLDLERLSYSTSLMRSAADAAGAEFILSETQAGPHERAWPNGFAGEGFGPDYLEQSARRYAERGAEQIWWFLWRPTHGGVEMGMNGLQSLDGGESPRTSVARKLAAKPATLRNARRQWLKRKLAYVHYSRNSLLQASYWPDQLPDLEDSLCGWHTLLEAAGYRVDFLDDSALTGMAPDARGLLVLPHSTVLDDAMVAALAAMPCRIIAGPHTAFLNQHGQLRGTRLPPPLRERWHVDMGLWRDTAPLPAAPGLPKLKGWRQLLPLPGSKAAHRLGNRSPWCVSSPYATVLGIDAGNLFLRATPPQRRALLQRLGFAK